MIYRIPNILLALIGSILLSLSWFAPFTFLIFIGFVPLLILEDKLSNSLSNKKHLHLVWLSYATFLIWNLLVTWWIYFASFGGAAMAILCNSLLMSMVFMIWHRLKTRVNKSWAIWLLIPIWLGFEYGHTLWDLTWTWLTLGNVFAFNHYWVQWYEYTGTSGGSLWVLISNILIFEAIKSPEFDFKAILKPTIVIILPIPISLVILSQKHNSIKAEKSYNTLVVQPNVDPYNEKFYLEPAIQLQNLLQQIKGKINANTDFLVLPETFLTENIFEGRENESFSFNFLKDSLLNKYPNLTIITGANTIYAYPANEKPSATARKFSDADLYYDAYNTGIQLNKDGFQYYHKSKLVPGVEKMPFPIIFKHLENLAINLGGTSGSLGTQSERTVFFNDNKQVGIAPVICYESVYPDYVGEYVRNGANLIFIITNDGWWENTPGHKQHLAYAKLRAIETRCEIARCANTGISCFINSTGDIEQATNYWKKAVIQKNVIPNSQKTFFVQFGDLISYSSSFLAIALFIWSQILRFKKS